MSLKEREKFTLDKDIKKLLIDNVERNGGVVLDPDFSDLEKYLTLNPSEEQKEDETSIK